MWNPRGTRDHYRLWLTLLCRPTLNARVSLPTPSKMTDETRTRGMSILPKGLSGWMTTGSGGWMRMSRFRTADARRCARCALITSSPHQMNAANATTIRALPARAKNFFMPRRNGSLLPLPRSYRCPRAIAYLRGGSANPLCGEAGHQAEAPDHKPA